MFEFDYQKELQKAQLHADKVKLKQELKEIRHANDEKRKSLSFSKVAVIFIFCNCVVIELYSMFAMFWLSDLTALGALIAAVVGQCVSLSGYFIKSGKENTSQGIVYETTMLELEHQYGLKTEEDDGAVG